MADQLGKNDAAPPQELGEEAPVEIHKPKRWRGFRGFLKEYLIIVVGVLTALAGEQLVEGLHWRHVAHDAREAMIPDERNLLRNAGEREAQSGCLATEFRAIRDVLDRASATGTLETASVRGPTRLAWTFSSYDGVVSGEVLPHFPAGERGAVTAIARLSVYLTATRDAESRAWNVLRTLEAPQRRASEAELANLRSALSEAIYQSALMRTGSRVLAQNIAQHRLLGPGEVKEIWASGVRERANDPRGACSSKAERDTDQLLHDLATPRTALAATP